MGFKNKSIKFAKIFCLLLSVNINLITVGNTQMGFDDSYDYISIHFAGKGRGDLKKPLEIFDNIQLKGKPALVIDNSKVTDLRSVIPQINNSLDFVIYYQNLGVNLKIEQLENGIAKILDKNQPYYLEMNPKLFIYENYPPSSHWKIIKGESAVKIYNELAEKEVNLKKILSNGLTCVRDKSIECLKTFFNENYDLFDAANLLWKYENLDCDKISDKDLTYDRSRRRDFSWNEYVSIPWSSLENVFLGKFKSDEIKVRTKNFGMIDAIVIDTRETIYCNGKAIKSIKISYRNQSTTITGSGYWGVSFGGFRQRNY